MRAPLSEGEHRDGAPPPARIGRYRVIAPLARGGMAEVYVVVREGRDTPSVLKRLLPELDTHPTARLRFQREAELSTRLQHERIVRTLRTATEDGRPSIEMELVPGHTVEEMMLELARHGRLPPLDVVIRVALDVLEGLRYAHQLRGDDGRPLGLVHRDISPRNIVLGLDGAARLIDFGIARAEWAQHLTAPGAILGTFSHASPEQVTGAPVDARSDLYSLGVVLFEMLTGQSLNPAGETMEMLRRITTGHPPPLRSLNPSLPEALESVLARALEKRPADRPPDAASFLAALSQAAPNDERESRRRLGALLGQLFPKGAEVFRRYEREAARIAGEELVAPTQLGDGPELTQAHTGFTELVGQKTTVDPTLLVRRRGDTRARAATRRRTRTAQGAAAAVAGLGLLVSAVVALRPRSEPPAPLPTTERAAAASPRAVAEPEPEPAPIEPAPIEPAPIEPAPIEPAPAASGEDEATPPAEPRPARAQAASADRARRRPELKPEPSAAAMAPESAARASPAARARVEALGAKLRANPSDPELFESTVGALRRAIAELPPAEQRPLRSRVQRAEVMNDASILLEALEVFLARSR